MIDDTDTYVPTQGSRPLARARTVNNVTVGGVTVTNRLGTGLSRPQRRRRRKAVLTALVRAGLHVPGLMQSRERRAELRKFTETLPGAIAEDRAATEKRKKRKLSRGKLEYGEGPVRK